MELLDSEYVDGSFIVRLKDFSLDHESDLLISVDEVVGMILHYGRRLAEK